MVFGDGGTAAGTSGLIGDFASRYFGPAPVHAQSPVFSQEVRARKFILVDESGKARGVFGIETNGAPEIEITDSKGHVLVYAAQGWTAVHGIFAGGIIGPKKADSATDQTMSTAPSQRRTPARGTSGHFGNRRFTTGAYRIATPLVKTTQMRRVTTLPGQVGQKKSSVMPGLRAAGKMAPC